MVKDAQQDILRIELRVAHVKLLAQEYLDTFGTTDQINTPERQELRRKIADELYGDGAAKKEGKVWLVLGVPASGKSTIADPLVEREGVLLIDSDEAKKLLPEFSNGLLAGAVNEESADIVINVMERAIINHDNIVWPIIGKTRSSIEEKMQNFKEAGYEVNLVYVDLPIEKAIERTKVRFRETGRLVSPRYLESVGLKSRENYDKIKTGKGVDSYEAWDNDVAFGEVPVRTEYGSIHAEKTGKDSSVTRGVGRRRYPAVHRGQDVGTNRKGTKAETEDFVAKRYENRSDDQGGFSMPKNTVQKKSAPLGKQEQEALTGTSEEAKEAYRIVRDKLAKSKNKAVARAVKVGATLFARHADIYAKAIAEKTGKKFTALDYYHTFAIQAGREGMQRVDCIGAPWKKKKKPSARSMRGRLCG